MLATTLKVITFPITIIVFLLALIVSSIAIYADLGSGFLSIIEGIVLIALNPIAYFLSILTFASVKFMEKLGRATLLVVFANIILLFVLFIGLNLQVDNQFAIGEAYSSLLFLVPQIFYLFWRFALRR